MSLQDPNMDSLRQRKRVFDAGWMALLLMLSLSASLVAYVDPAHFDAVPVAWGLFGIGLLYALASRRLAQMEDPLRLSNALFATQLIGVLGLGLFWYRLGGLHNPAMLLAFSIPMSVACVHRTGWQVFSIAFSCVFVVTLGALVESPELRWYLAHTLGRIGVPGLGSWFDALPLVQSERPFAEASVSPGQSITLVTSFVLGIATLALAVDGLRSVLEGLLARVAQAETNVTRQSLRATDALRSSLLPTVLVYADNVLIADVSDSFEQAFDQPRANLIGRNLFEVVDWSHPDTVEDLLRAGGGELKSTIQRIADRLSIQSLRIQLMRHEGRDCALITLADTSDRWLLDHLLGANSKAAFLIGPNARISHASEQTLFPGAVVGAPAASALGVETLDADWWQPAPLTRDQIRVVLDETHYLARCETLRLPGERDGWTLVELVETGSPR